MPLFPGAQILFNLMLVYSFFEIQLDSVFPFQKNLIQILIHLPQLLMK